MYRCYHVCFTVRYVLYGLIMALTFGKHKFFLFPNLTEDCGFFESFLPLYEYRRAGEEKSKKSKKKSKGIEQQREQPTLKLFSL